MKLARNFTLMMAAFALVPGLFAAPGDNTQPFTITISASQSTVKVGEAVRIHVVMANVSDQEVNLLTEFDAACDYRIKVQGKNGSQRHDPDCSGSAVFLHLKPGKQYGSDTNLSTILRNDATQGDMVRVFDFTSQGEYVIQFSRHVADDPDKEIVKSNKLTITVTE